MVRRYSRTNSFMDCSSGEAFKFPSLSAWTGVVPPMERQTGEQQTAMVTERPLDPGLYPRDFPARYFRQMIYRFESDRVLFFAQGSNLEKVSGSLTAWALAPASLRIGQRAICLHARAWNQHSKAPISLSAYSCKPIWTPMNLPDSGLSNLQ